MWRAYTCSFSVLRHERAQALMLYTPSYLHQFAARLARHRLSATHSLRAQSRCTTVSSHLTLARLWLTTHQQGALRFTHESPRQGTGNWEGPHAPCAAVWSSLLSHSYVLPLHLSSSLATLTHTSHEPHHLFRARTPPPFAPLLATRPSPCASSLLHLLRAVASAPEA